MDMCGYKFDLGVFVISLVSEQRTGLIERYCQLYEINSYLQVEM